MIINKTIPKILLRRTLVFTALAVCTASLVFAIIDSIKLISNEDLSLMSGIEDILFRFVLVLGFAIIPVLFGSSILAYAAYVLKQNNKGNSVWVMSTFGGVLGSVLGFVLCIIAVNLMGNRMPYDIFFRRVVIVEILSIITGVIVGRYITSSMDKLEPNTQ